jgi:hypothetical protein
LNDTTAPFAALGSSTAFTLEWQSNYSYVILRETNEREALYIYFHAKKGQVLLPWLAQKSEPKKYRIVGFANRLKRAEIERR